nr:putative BCR, YaiI/YqxD family COG1671 [uncultured bacterium]AMP50764.1 putative BCR, YaiI/YqxD family COG1671 [uncultured bacterium]AMP50780.1 putative BCR, YaiI/YqxD family COG1671 [uncultured bacterium]AMP50885.1 putative BCR, YaiI/YqxD family COG1671 [uncultured bacterium]
MSWDKIVKKLKIAIDDAEKIIYLLVRTTRWRVGRVVMQQIANLSSRMRCIGSSPILSASCQNRPKGRFFVRNLRKKKMVELYIDGDACPVKMEVIKVAERHGLKIHIAGNSWIRFPLVAIEINQVLVPKTPDAADNWIAEHIGENDIVITSDIPLASRCLNKKALAIRPNGTEFTEDNIGMSLGMRELNNYLREVGEKGDFQAPFSKQDRSNFLSKLENLVQKAKCSG